MYVASFLACFLVLSKTSILREGENNKHKTDVINNFIIYSYLLPGKQASRMAWVCLRFNSESLPSGLNPVALLKT